MQKPLIISLLDTPAYGGAEEYMVGTLAHLSKQGYPVLLAINNPFVTSAVRQRIQEEGLKNFTVIPLPYILDAIGNWKGLVKFFLRVPGALVWMFQLIGNVRKNNHQMLFLLAGFSDRLLFSPLIYHMHIPLVWIEFGPLKPTFVRNAQFPKLLYRLARFTPHRIITISKYTKRSLTEDGHIPKGLISIAYPGVPENNLSKLTVYKKHEPGLRSRYKLGNKKIVSVVARLASEKEIDLLLRAWKKWLQMSTSAKDYVLLIVGDGPERAKLEKLASTLSISSSARFTGFVSTTQKFEILTASSLFVFPSAWELEGFGMTSAEAMLCGVPVLSTGAGPQAELIIEGKTGYHFKAHDSDSLAFSLEHVHNDNKRERIGLQGQAHVLAHFTQGQQYKHIQKIIESLL